MQVLNTIVEKVQLPEDRAIILAGYEQQISEMFRGANPGLSSRFDCDSPWRFDDFSDDDYRYIDPARRTNRSNRELA
jgi:hypothetical protein